MSGQYEFEMIFEKLIAMTSAHLTVGHVLAIFLIFLIYKALKSQQRDESAPSSPPYTEPARAGFQIAEPELAPIQEIPADKIAAIGMALHLYTNAGKNLRLSDLGMKAAAIGLALHLEKTSGMDI